jgi:hypothetical protein
MHAVNLSVFRSSGWTPESARKATLLYCLRPWRLPLPALQLFAISGVVSETLPFWATRWARAFCGFLQMFSELTRRPFLPPFKLRTNFETGASGT